MDATTPLLCAQPQLTNNERILNYERSYSFLNLIRIMITTLMRTIFILLCEQQSLKATMERKFPSFNKKETSWM